jgi:hypothetical protein
MEVRGTDSVHLVPFTTAIRWESWLKLYDSLLPSGPVGLLIRKNRQSFSVMQIVNRPQVSNISNAAIFGLIRHCSVENRQRLISVL